MELQLDQERLDETQVFVRQPLDLQRFHERRC
jgi:hypothetical protein